MGRRPKGMVVEEEAEESPRGGPAFVDREWIVTLTRRSAVVDDGPLTVVCLGGLNHVALVWDRDESRVRLFIRRKIEWPMRETLKFRHIRSSFLVEIHLRLDGKGRIERPDMLVLLGMLGVDL